MANVVFDQGVYLPELGLWLDSRRKREQAVITHAHADHVGRHSTPVFTSATKRLLTTVLGNRGITLAYGEPLEGPRCRVTLYPSAHCLGAAQVLVEVKDTGVRVLYTGDLKTRSNPTAPDTQPVPCDVLVLDATYGDPRYRFPPAEQALSTLRGTVSDWLARDCTPVVLGYRVGKAQEAMAHLLRWGFSVAAHPAVYEVARAYEEEGVVFGGTFRRLDGPARDGEVVVAPPGHRSLAALQSQHRVRTMFLTGWAAASGASWFRADAAVPLSDHCDFDDLLGYVEAVRPQRVLAAFGGGPLVATLRSRGYDARLLSADAPQQMTLI